MSKDYSKIIDSLEWNVFYWDFNANKLSQLNIFHTVRFAESLDRRLNTKLTREEFYREVKAICAYSFWSKAEYELIIRDLFERGNWEACLTRGTFTIKPTWYGKAKKEVTFRTEDVFELDDYNMPYGRYYIQSSQYDTSVKIDIYEQLNLNMDKLVDYIINKTGYKPLEDKWEKK